MAKAFIDDTNLTNIGNAIRSQNGTTTTYLPSEMADAINALPVLDTSDGTATSDDIIDGVTAYVNGEKITGNIPYSSVSVRTSVEPSICSYGEDKTLYLCLQYPSTGHKRVIGNGKLFDLSRPLSDFGDATSEDVAFGKRYTSANGFNVQGTVSKVESGDFLTLSNGVVARESDTLRTSATLDKDKLMRIGSKVVINTDLSRFGDAKAADVASGKTFTSIEGLKITGTATIGEGLDTSDATATASDIAYNKTAYVNGEKVTGTLAQKLANTTYFMTDTTPTMVSTDLRLNPNVTDDVILRKNSTVIVDCPLTNLGDASASDVAAGKTFTSTAGVKVTGTASSSSSGGLTVKSGTTTSATISTGLSSIDYIVIYKTALSGTGLIQAIYNAGTDTLNYVHCSSYSSYTKTCAVSASTASSVSGGTFTLGLSGTSGLSSGVTYYWTAFGQA